MAGFLGHLFRAKDKKSIFCSAVVVAAGSATRMKGQDKIMAPLGGEPVLARTLRPLEDCALVREIVVVTREDLVVEAAKLCKDYLFTKVTKVVVGGDTRTKSVFAGIRETAPDAELIAIHDGARPFVTDEVLREVILRGAECGAAAPAVPVKDTVKRASRGMVVETLERDSLYLVQTPQVFEASLIKAALLKAMQDGAAVTDDCSAVERLGVAVALTRGSEENIKITTPADLLFGNAILEGREYP